MKTFVIFALMASSLLYYGCQVADNKDITPVATTQQINIEGRNLRPATGEKPDLKIYPFFVSGTITRTATHYMIPFSLKELNIGTADTGTYPPDTMKVYEKRLPFETAFFVRNLSKILFSSAKNTQNIKEQINEIEVKC